MLGVNHKETAWLKVVKMKIWGCLQLTRWKMLREATVHFLNFSIKVALDFKMYTSKTLSLCRWDGTLCTLCLQ
jgi:hypothetical protein